jgi:hypothetical protein
MADAVSAVKRFVTNPTAFLVLVALLVAALVGCGIKGPPVPPRTPPIPAVENLSYQLEGQTITLNWQLAEPLSNESAKRSNFEVYQSTTAADQPVCESCPVIFEKLITLAYIHSEEKSYATDVFFDPGYRYTFKVRLVTNGRAGPDSNLVIVSDNPNDAQNGTTGQLQ